MEPKETLGIYDHIELTEDELALVIFEAKKQKAASIKLAEYKQKLFSEQKYPSFDPATLFEMVKAIPNFVVDEFNRDIIWKMCMYFTNDPKSTLDFKKGLLLFGPVGCGKSTLMEFFKRNQTNSFVVYSARDVADSYAKHGADVITKYKSLIKTSSPEEYFGQKELGVCFDDIGIEVDRKNYGNESNVLGDILLTRYDTFFTRADKNIIIPGKTHVTTNLDAVGIGERYGDRVRSRFKEMFNLLTFDKKAPDRRK